MAVVNTGRMRQEILWKTTRRENEVLCRSRPTDAKKQTLKEEVK